MLIIFEMRKKENANNARVLCINNTHTGFIHLLGKNK
jgi:hypothetical protein